MDALSAKVHSVAGTELLREAVYMAANVWALRYSLDALDDWTTSAARPAWQAEGTAVRVTAGAGQPWQQVEAASNRMPASATACAQHAQNESVCPKQLALVAVAGCARFRAGGAHTMSACSPRSW